MVKLIDFMLYYQIKPFEIPSTLVCLLICYLSIEAIKQKRADYLSGKIKGCKIGGGFTTGESYYKNVSSNTILPWWHYLYYWYFMAA